MEEKVVTLPASSRGPAMAGTLTWPTVGCPCPAAILLQGAGSHDRDYTLFGQKHFAVLAEYLADQGIVSLRFDERGVGESGGTPGTASAPQMASDVAEWVGLLRDQAVVDPSRVGLVGHSEGGIVAALAARSLPGLAFLALVATPGLPGLEYNLQYEASMSRATGLDEASIQARTHFQTRALRVLLEESDRPRAEAALRSLYGELTPPLAPGQIQRTISHLLSPRFIFNLRYDPAQTLRGLNIPVLAVYGEKDVQVPPEGNAEAMGAILDVGSGRDRVLVLPGLNHFMQTASTGFPEEYSRIQEPLAPQAMKLIAQWIRTHNGSRAGGGHPPRPTSP